MLVRMLGEDDLEALWALRLRALRDDPEAFGATYDEALADVKSAIAFHVETFGPSVIENDSDVLETFVTETGVIINE